MQFSHCKQTPRRGPLRDRLQGGRFRRAEGQEGAQLRKEEELQVRHRGRRLQRQAECQVNNNNNERNIFYWRAPMTWYFAWGVSLPSYATGQSKGKRGGRRLIV
jgi:hypothetical protein